MVRTRAFAGALLLAVTASNGAAQRADSAEVVRVAETLLRAISTKDTVLAKSTLVPGAVFVGVFDPAPDTARAEIETDAAFYGMLRSTPAAFLERMQTPSVRFLGASLAEVSAPYDFHVDGKFSHCGTDVFTLVRSGGAWRITSTTYTMRRRGCAPSPLGPPVR